MPGLVLRMFPALAWMRRYSRADLRQDLPAGLTTAVMLIPQAMAYAMLAGLPPTVGLYASTLPLIVYAFMGSSRQLAVGPVAMDSLLVATALAPLATVGGPEYVAYAVTLALMVGVIQAALGLVRAGFLVNFLSQPVVGGFTSAAAIIIGLSQLKHLLGVDIPRSPQAHKVVLAALERVGEVDLYTLALGVAAIVALVWMKKRVPKWPRALLVVAGSTLIVWAFGLDQGGVAIVADVPAGLPAPGLPRFDVETLQTLLPAALVISLIAFMEAISVAQALASRNRYAVDPNQEFVALGMANIAAGFFRGYPVTGGFSRSAVNDQAGARTGAAGLVTAAVVIITLLFLTELFFYLPKAALAAVIMTAVFGLIDLGKVRQLWAVDRADLTLLGLTFMSTLVLGIQTGIGIGVGASVLWFVIRATRPHTAILGRLPGTTAYRNVDRFSEVEKPPGTLVIRIDASFYFGNVSFLKQTFAKHLADPKIVDVVIDGSSINRLDSSADAALRELAVEFAERGIGLYFAGLKGPVRDTMQRSGLAELLGERGRHLLVHDAVQAALQTRKAQGLQAS